MVSEAERPASAETPNDFGAFPRLEPAQVDMLAAHGERRPINRGDVLYREGEVVADFFVVLAGSVAIVAGFERDDRVLTVHGPGSFLGELSLLVNQPAFVTAVAQEAGEVLAVPVTRLRQLVAEDPDLGDLILRAYLARRSFLIEAGSGFKIIGSRYSPDTRRLRDFAARNRLPHKLIDLEADHEAESLLQSLGIAPEETPVVIWRNVTVLRNPSNRDIARIAGLPVPSGAETICDLGIVGAGPAGLAAAVYGASEGLDTVILDGVAAGGQAGTSSRIENYLGFPSGISGWDLAQRALIQAQKFGARILVPAEATALEGRDGHHVVVIEGGTPLVSRTLVLATGAGYRKLDVPGIDQLEPACIHYAATQLETNACAAIPVAVVGGGNSAAQAALSLALRAQRVHLVLREAHLTENMSRYLADRIKRDPNIDVHCHNEVRELIGSRWLDGVVIEDIQTGERRTVEVKALFVFIGAEPNTGWLRGQLDVDDAGFIRTGHSGSYLETSRPGVFAAGDVRSGSVRRVAAAVGDGAMVVRLVHERLGAVRL